MRNLKILFLLFSIVILSCNNVPENKSDNKTVTDIKEENKPALKIETRIFRNDTMPGSNLTGFGYDIIIDGKPYIHQPHIPAVSGSKGFFSEEDARKTAEYVAEKIRQTNDLPALKERELDSLGIKLN